MKGVVPVMAATAAAAARKSILCGVGEELRGEVVKDGDLGVVWMGSDVSAIRTTLNGEGSVGSSRLGSLVTENTSNGPQKSSTSTPL